MNLVYIEITAPQSSLHVLYCLYCTLAPRSGDRVIMPGQQQIPTSCVHPSLTPPNMKSFLWHMLVQMLVRNSLASLTPSTSSEVRPSNCHATAHVFFSLPSVLGVIPNLAQSALSSRVHSAPFSQG